ncbi:MAG TPA: NAD(P)H-dependent glycerol-3-phosphate dehydrogenase [Tepidiformaceae bacterium]
MADYAVVGATSWGTTLAWLLARNGHRTWLVARDDGEARRVDSRRGIDRLPGLVLPSLVSTCGPEDIPAGLTGMIAAVPAQAMRSTLLALPALREVPALSAAKGIELTSGLRMTEVLLDLGWHTTDVACLSGPNLSHEIASGLPAAAVVGAATTAVGAAWQVALSGGAFRVYHTDDVVGVELAGALKNVIAIAAGAAVGLGMGANTVAAILTRGLAEVTRLGVAMGARQATFLGLAGVGDMAATCYSPLSRNRQLGELLARGQSLAQAVVTIGEAVEGIQTAPVALELARRKGVAAPITEQVCSVLAGTSSVASAMGELLARPPGAESKPEA